MDNFTTAPRPPTHHPSQSRTHVLTSSNDAIAVRDGLEAWLRSQAPAIGDLGIYEISLACTELMSNALEHGESTISRSSSCLVDMRRAKNSLTVTVTNDAPNAAVLPPAWWVMPDPSELRGRGLAIVKTVADDIELHVTATSVAVAATFDLAEPPAPQRAQTVAAPLAV